MKRLTLISLFVFYAAGQALASPEIRAVDLYPSGAKFTFAVQAEGSFQADLPGAFESVRLLNVDDARVVEGSRARWIPPALTELKAQVDAQRRAVSLLSARRASLEQTQSLLKSLKPEKGTGQDVAAYIQEAQGMRLQVENELAGLAAEQGEAEETLQRLQEELDARTPDGRVMRVAGRAQGTVTIEAFTSSASWVPRYRMDLTGGVIETRLYARAWQRTGLDYTGPVTFHTKRPDERVTSPSVRPLRVGLKAKPKPEEDYAADYMMAAAESAPRLAMANAALKRAEPQMTETLSDRAVAGSGALTGDGREAEFVLGDLELTGTPLLIAVPEQRQGAWIVVSMDSVAAPLIPGQADLMVDGQPSGAAALPEYGLGQRQIPFGYAPQITARKEPLVEKRGTSWFSGVFAGGYTLEVTNGMREARTVTVKDRLPIPTDEKITLTVRRIEPQPKERDRENRLTWELPLKAGETAKILVDYTLSYPSGEELEYRP